MNNKPQQETTLAREQRRKMIEWSKSIPDGSFVDDPRADGHDKNGTARRKPAYEFSNGGMDLGRYPPNE